MYGEIRKFRNDLGVGIIAAEDGRARQTRVDGEHAHVLEDLRGQLARGREDERARSAARLADEAVQDGQEKRGRLAAARLGAGEQVAAFEGERDAVRLNRRGPDEAHFLGGAEQIGMERERRE